MHLQAEGHDGTDHAMVGSALDSCLEKACPYMATPISTRLIMTLCKPVPGAAHCFEHAMHAGHAALACSATVR